MSVRCVVCALYAFRLPKSLPRPSERALSELKSELKSGLKSELKSELNIKRQLQEGLHLKDIPLGEDESEPCPIGSC